MLRTKLHKTIRYLILTAVALSLVLISCSDGGGGGEGGNGTDTETSTAAPRIYVTRNAAPVYSGTGPYPFGNVLPGDTSNPVTFSVTNSGGRDLSIESVSITGESAADFSHDFSGEAAVSSGETLEIICTFSPTTAIEGPRYAQLNIVHSDTASASPYVIKLQGFVSVAAPEISVLDGTNNTLLSGTGSRHFGSVLEGSGSATDTFTIKNTGNTALDLDPDDNGIPDISVSDAVNFTLDVSSTATSLEAYGESGNTTTFDITYDPPAAGYHTATVTVASSDSDESSYTFTVSGNANSTAVSNPEINVKIGSTNYNSGDEYNFGDVTESETSGAKTVTVQNLGNANLVISAVSDPGGEFGRTAAGLPATVVPGGQYTFTVTFNPADQGVETATVTVTNNDGDEGAFDIDLRGRGTGSTITMTAAPTDFGSIPANTTGNTQQYTIRNDGNSTLTVSNVSLDTGTNYIINSFPASSIQPAGTSSFYVTFTPTAVDPALTDTITITTNDVDTPNRTINITGEGAANPVLTMTAAPTDFGSTDINTDGNMLSYTLRNDGTTNLNITGITVTDTDSYDLYESDGTSVLDGADFPVDLDPADSFNFKVRFTPITAGTRNATINIAGDGIDPAIAITGLSRNAEIDIDATTAPAGAVNDSGNYNPAAGFDTIVGSTSNEMLFSIENNGSTNLELYSINISDANNFYIDTMPASPIPAANSDMLGIRFRPQTAGAHSTVVTITNNDQTGNENIYTFTITGIDGLPDEPEIVNTADISFPGTTAVGSDSAPREVSIGNDGLENLIITSASISGPNSSDFYISAGTFPQPPIAGGTGESTGTNDIEVTFRPTGTGARSANLNITSNDPDDPTIQIPLTGTGVEQEIDITGPVPGDFSDVTVGEAPSVITYTINNTGGNPLTIHSITLSDTTNFSISGGTLGGSSGVVPASSDRTFIVSFDPQTYGTFPLTVTVSSDDADEGTIVLSETGAEAPDGLAPDISLISGVADFGSVDESLSRSYNFTIRNDGNAELNITSIVSDSDPPFAVSNVPATVAAGSTESFTVTFSPAGPGAVNAEISIDSDDPDEDPYNINVFGTGIDSAPDASIVPSTEAGAPYDFGTTPINTSSSVIICQITNTGTADLTINSLDSGGADPGEFMVNDSTITPLAPGSTTYFSVSHTPSSAGPHTMDLTIDTDLAVDPVVYFQGAVSAPEIDPLTVGGINPGDFGATGFEESAGAQNLTITNSGNAALTVTDVTLGGANPGDFVLTKPALPFPIAAGDDSGGAFTVDFIPAEAGARSAVITVHSDDSDEPAITIDVSGDGNAVPVFETPVLVAGAISDTLVGTTSTEYMIRITNSGGDGLDVSDGPVISGTHASEFSINTDVAINDMPTGNNDGSFGILFHPTSLGTKNATLTFSSNDPDNPTRTMTLAGKSVSSSTVDDTDDRGQYASIAVRQSDGTTSAAGTLYVSYHDATSGSLMFTRSEDGGGTWLTPVQIDTPNVGQYSSIAVDEDNDDVFITYYDAGNQNLKYAYSTSNGDGLTWNDGNIDTSGNDVGQWASMTNDSTDLYVGYYDATQGDVKLAFASNADIRTGTPGWTILDNTTLDASGGGAPLATNIGQYTSMSNDGSGNFYLSYYDDTNSDIKVIRYNGGVSGPHDPTPVIVSTFTHTSVAAQGGTSVVYVPFFDSANGDLAYSVSLDQGASWTDGWIAQPTTVAGEFVSSIVDSDGDLHVAYYDETNSRLMHGLFNGIWSISTVDNSADVGQWTSIGVIDDVVYIVYYNADNGALKIAKSVDGGESW